MENFFILFLSHILSGACTALMYSVFEAWYVAEHTSRGYPADWRSRTFATATFLNGLVAIFAGLVANQLVDSFGIGSPYVFAMMLLGFAGFLVSTTWNENYGEPNGNVKRLINIFVNMHCFTVFFLLLKSNHAIFSIVYFVL